jgi:hypothetical protein
MSTFVVLLVVVFVYSQTCVQRPPLEPEKSGRWTEVPDKTEN